MLLDIKQHREEFSALIEQYLHEPFTSGTYFGIKEDEELQAIAALKCYMGTWYLRACVVKPEHRGQGMQRKLIGERLDYLRTEKPNVPCVRVTIYPENTHSIDNCVEEGFAFEKKKKLRDGTIANVYKKMLK